MPLRMILELIRVWSMLKVPFVVGRAGGLVTWWTRKGGGTCAPPPRSPAGLPLRADSTQTILSDFLKRGSHKTKLLHKKITFTRTLYARASAESWFRCAIVAGSIGCHSIEGMLVFRGRVRQPLSTPFESNPMCTLQCNARRDACRRLPRETRLVMSHTRPTGTRENQISPPTSI